MSLAKLLNIEEQHDGYIHPHERFDKYDGDKCWQGHLRELNIPKDLQDAGLTQSAADSLRTSDFQFEYIPDQLNQLLNHYNNQIDSRYQQYKQLHQ